MDALLTELVGLLTREIELHRELLSLLQKEKEFLIDLSTEELLENNKKKETATLQIKMLEESRSSLMSRLAQHLAVPPRELTVSKLVSLLEEPQRSALEAARSKLISLLRSIQDVNQHNCVLVRDSLHYAQQSLNVLYRSSSPNPTYLVNGSMKGPQRFGGLLSKEI